MWWIVEFVELSSVILAHPQLLFVFLCCWFLCLLGFHWICSLLSFNWTCTARLASGRLLTEGFSAYVFIIIIITIKEKFIQVLWQDPVALLQLFYSLGLSGILQVTKAMMKKKQTFHW